VYVAYNTGRTRRIRVCVAYNTGRT